MNKKKENKQRQAGKKNSPNVLLYADKKSRKYYGVLALILLVSFIVYLPVFRNGFVWDDSLYILDNSFIKDLSWKGIKAIFNDFSSDNYSPITVCILALQYKISGLSPAAFHFGSLFFHLLNVALVFWFIKLLSKRWKLASITALLFCIHPMQVESVAWASGGSTLYYATFFLCSMIAYLYFLRDKQKKYLIISLFFFLLSSFSKAVAVVLPLVLLLIDYLMNRKLTGKVLLEKFPYLIISLGIGILTIVLKNRVGSMHLVDYNYFDRLLFSCYALVLYLLKLLVPTNLSCVYNYPRKHNDFYSIWVYLSPLIIFSLSYLIYKSKTLGKEIIFGFGFFIITILFVLQLLPVGGVIMADRYTYLPYIGFFFIIAWGLDNVLSNESNNFKTNKILSIILFSAIIIAFCFLTFNRTKVWHDNISLWSDVVENSGEESINYKCRGDAYREAKQYDKAINDYNYSIQLNNKVYQVYYNRGLTYYYMDKYDEAIKDFTSAISLNPSLSKAIHGRGLSFSKINKYEEAIRDFTLALKQDKTFIKAYYDRGLVYEKQKKYNEAIADYTITINHNKNHSEAYNNRGISFAQLGELDKALEDFISAIKANPQNINACNNLGNTYFSRNDFEEAIKAYTSTIQLSQQFVSAYYNRSLAYSNIKQYDLAYKDAIKAKELGYAVDPNYVERLLKSINKGISKN